MTTKISEYKGNPILEFHESDDCTDRWPVRLGLRKCQAILTDIEAIKAFVANAEPKKEVLPTPRLVASVFNF